MKLLLLSTIYLLQSPPTLVQSSYNFGNSAVSSVSRPSGLDCPRLCPDPCTYTDHSLPACPHGVSKIRDDCGCECPVCARQLGEECFGMEPCDPVKNLYCDEQTKRCENKPGRKCYIGGTVYSSGETFKPSCKLNCTCLDGDVGCMPACKIELENQKPTCPTGQFAKRIKRKGECCEEYVCSRKDERHSSDNYRQFSHSRGIVVGAAARRPTSIELTKKKDCLVQTTQWTPCSKTCGIGISERVSNDNKNCRLRRQVRLCNVRPCRKDLLPPQAAKKCSKTVKSTKSIRLSFSGCISERKFKPRYCGSCGNKCCIPDKTKTRKFQLICSDTNEVLEKEYMWISNCKCSEEYCNLSSEIFYGYEYMKSDYSRNK